MLIKFVCPRPTGDLKYNDKLWIRSTYWFKGPPPLGLFIHTAMAEIIGPMNFCETLSQHSTITVY